MLKKALAAGEAGETACPTKDGQQMSLFLNNLTIRGNSGGSRSAV